MQHFAFTLYFPFDNQQPGLQQDTALAPRQVRPDDHLDEAGFIFQGYKNNT